MLRLPEPSMDLLSQNGRLAEALLPPVMVEGKVCQLKASEPLRMRSALAVPARAAMLSVEMKAMRDGVDTAAAPCVLMCCVPGVGRRSVRGHSPCTIKLRFSTWGCPLPGRVWRLRGLSYST